MAVRVDKWLWSVRAFKTRTQANDACASGRVRVNGEVAKPATKVAVGDRVEARRRERTIVYEVVQELTKRVSATLAADAVVDHSPPPPDRPTTHGDVVELVQARRDRGSGRPTKRDRRDIERLRGRE